MIRNCKNCAGKVVFDIHSQKLYCNSCGSYFSVSDYGIEEDYKEKEPVVDEKDTMERSIFTCNSCGAQITLGKNEASTFCVYCGNPTIVFSRIAKIKKPEMIIPFKVSKEEALALVKQKIKKGFFIPKEIKNLKVDALRGIYIPYFVTSVECDASAVISGKHKSGKHTVTRYYLRSFWTSMPWITTDASTTLSDSSSQRIEPYDIREAQVFDEDYLLNFYSDIADVSYTEAMSVAKGRAKDIMHEELIKSGKGHSKKIHHIRENYEVYEKPVTAMLPAWFLTFRYENVPYTILVNGQTGKVVGGVPWDKKKFAITLGIIGSFLSVITTYFFSLSIGNIPIRELGNATSFLIYTAVLAGIIIFIGWGYMKKVLKAIGRTSASTLNHFTNQRKGDNL